VRGVALVLLLYSLVGFTPTTSTSASSANPGSSSVDTSIPTDSKARWTDIARGGSTPFSLTRMSKPTGFAGLNGVGVKLQTHHPESLSICCIWWAKSRLSLSPATDTMPTSPFAPTLSVFTRAVRCSPSITRGATASSILDCLSAWSSMIAFCSEFEALHSHQVRPAVIRLPMIIQHTYTTNAVLWAEAAVFIDDNSELILAIALITFSGGIITIGIVAIVWSRRNLRSIQERERKKKSLGR